MKRVRQKLNLSFLHPSPFVLLFSDGTRDPSAPESTVASGNLFQVLLVMVLSVVEALALQDLCGNATVAFLIQLLATKDEQKVKCFRVLSDV